MAGYPPPYPPPGTPPGAPPPGYDPRDQRRYERDQQRAQRYAYKAQRDLYRYQMRGLRRGSILGPILLIAIGIVFLLLQTGRIDTHRFWDWYGHSWPLLLVGAGIVLLAEWGFDQFYLRDPEHPQYRRSIGGSVFLLFIIFAVTGVVAGTVMHRPDGMPILGNWPFNQGNLDELFGDKHESDQSLDYDLPIGSSLAVNNPHGDVTISGTSGDGRIHVAIHKQVYARNDADADSKAQQLTPQISNQTGNRITITHLDNKFSTLEGTSTSPALNLTIPTLDGARADLILTVPPAAAVAITANHGDIHASGLNANVSAIANHGDIELSDITGPTTAHINNRGSSISAHNIGGGLSITGHTTDATVSDITGPVSLNGDFYGSVHLEHINGPLHFHSSRSDFQLVRLDGQFEINGSDFSASQALGPVTLTTSHNNVTLDRASGPISVTNHNGDIDLTAAPDSSGKLDPITLEDRVGSIKLIVPDHAGFSIQADTTNGDIDTDLPLTTTTSDTSRGNNHGHKTLNGTIGSGGPLIHITTTNGDISIHKGSVAALPATPPKPPAK
jgi:DUF4097 and DUF4098 domain-containing protein YvlB